MRITSNSVFLSFPVNLFYILLVASGIFVLATLQGVRPRLFR